MPIAPLSPQKPRPTGAWAAEEILSKPINPDYFEPPAVPALPFESQAPQVFPRKFGVEIEMVHTPQFTLRTVSNVLRKALPGRSATLVVFPPQPRDEYDVYDDLDRRWEVKPDEPNLEVATPPLRTHADLAMLQRAVTALAQAGATCDHGTGVHVHVDADAIDARALTYLLALTARHEPYIFSALQVEQTRRSMYCRPLALAEVKRAVRAAPRTIDELAAAFRVKSFVAKFVGVNFEPIFSRGGFGTIEFRYFNGCLDPHAIGCYVGYAVALMHHVATEAATPTPEGAATLPGLLETLGLAPESPISRLLCDQLRQNLEGLIAHSPRLATLVRSQRYTGDAALLLAMGIPAQNIERALTDASYDAALLEQAVGIMRYIPASTTQVAFEHLRDVPVADRAEVVVLAKRLLDSPHFESYASAVFGQLCRVPQPFRAQWVHSAKCAPVRVLVHFSPKHTPSLAYAFSQMGLQNTTFPGSLQLARKILNVLQSGPGAVKEKMRAMAATEWLRLGDCEVRGRLMLALLDLTPQDITRLAELTQPVLAQLVSLNAYATVLESFCAAAPEAWGTYADRLANFLSGPRGDAILKDLLRGNQDLGQLLEGNKDRIEAAPSKALVYA